MTNKWFRAEDAPDFIFEGAMVLKQYVEWNEPIVERFDPNYDRRTHACGGFFFMPFSWPKGPEMDHSLPYRTEP